MTAEIIRFPPTVIARLSEYTSFPDGSDDYATYDVDQMSDPWHSMINIASKRMAEGKPRAEIEAEILEDEAGSSFCDVQISPASDRAPGTTWIIFGIRDVPD